jgi:hypothetical protein
MKNKRRSFGSAEKRFAQDDSHSYTVEPLWLGQYPEEPR